MWGVVKVSLMCCIVNVFRLVISVISWCVIGVCFVLIGRIEVKKLFRLVVWIRIFFCCLGCRLV